MTHITKPNAAENSQAGQLLAVMIGTQPFALPIQSIREIRGWIATTALPHAPYYIKGMLNLRGAVLLVVSLAERLGLPAAEPNAASVIVVVESAGRAAGVLVDAVSDIITITEEMRHLTPHAGSTAAQEFLDGLILRDEQIISIINIPAILPDEDVQAALEAA
jgi:purine-binding chemotaxis protein CheW